MHGKTSVAILAAVIALAMAFSADAASRRTVTAQQVGPVQRTVYTYIDESGRKRTRIIVQRRSFLDAGTEVLPGQRKYHDYAYPPYRDPFDPLGPGRGAYERNPISPRWEYGGPAY
ncbi:MAG TPA: hypothetical protein VNL39_13420 [Xanthobacteraceae bacterium]|nr:hypothetical protein [Xanthobacteraceae bacterium]